MAYKILARAALAAILAVALGTSAVAQSQRVPITNLPSAATPLTGAEKTLVIQSGNAVLAPVGAVGPIFQGVTAPAAPALYALWWNTASNPGTLSIWDGGQWVAFASLDAAGHVFALTGVKLTGTITLTGGTISGGTLSGITLDCAGSTCTNIPAAAVVGTLPSATLPMPTTTALGGIKASTAPLNQYVSGIDTSGAAIYSQPSCASLSDSATGCFTANPVTAAGSLTAHGVVIGSGGRAVGVTAAPSAGQLLVGQASADPVPQTLSGDVTVSAAGVTAIQSNVVTNAKAAQMAADTIKGNASGAAASPSDIVLPACGDTGGNHLNYNTTTHTWSCGTSSNGQINPTQGSVTAAATTDLSVASNTYQVISGNTTITSFGTGQNLYRILRFTGTPLLTYNATSLITDTGQNIQAAPDDVMEVSSDGSGNWRIISYTPHGGIIKNSAIGGTTGSAGSYVSQTGITLLPGKWLLSGQVSSGSNSSNTWLNIAIGPTANSATGTTLGESQVYSAYDSAGGSGMGSIAPFDVTVTTSTLEYLNVLARTNAQTANSFIRAERIH